LLRGTSKPTDTEEAATDELIAAGIS
jgi:hypothetical protein